MDRKLLMACIIVFITYVGAFIRVPVVPLFATELGASKFEVGLITFGFMIVAGLLAFPLGFASDKSGRKLFIFVGLALSFLSSFFMAFSSSTTEIILFYMLGGVGIASFAPSISSYVGDISREMGKSYGWFTAAMQSGMAAGPSVGGLVADISGYRDAFLISSVFMAVSITITMFLPEADFPRRAGNILSELKRLMSIRGIYTSWIAVLSIAFAFGLFMPFFPLYVSELGYTTMLIGLLFTVQSASNATGRIPAGYISDRYGKRDVFISSGLLIFGVGMFMIPFLKGLPELFVVVGIIGLVMGVVTTNLSAMLAESAPEGLRGLTMSGFNSFLYLGFASSSIIGGKVIQMSGYMAGFTMALLVCIAGSMVFTYASKRP